MVLDRPSPHRQHPGRDAKGARRAQEYLIDKGHTAIAMLTGPAPTPMIHWRVQGYREALLAHGLAFRPELVCSGAAVFERGRISTHTLLSQFPQVTAILAYNKHALGSQATTRLLDMLWEPATTFPPGFVPTEHVLRESA